VELRRLIEPYFAHTAHGGGALPDAEGAAQQLQTTVVALGVPLTRTGPAHWRFSSDVGWFELVLDEYDDQEASVAHRVGSLPRQRKDPTDRLVDLMSLNRVLSGPARFALEATAAASEIVIWGAVAVEELGSEWAVGRLLLSALEARRELDGLLAAGAPAAVGVAPQGTREQANALPGPNWYPDPYRHATLRYWDGAQWTPHTR
jgi:hypothetical protein